MNGSRYVVPKIAKGWGLVPKLINRVIAGIQAIVYPVMVSTEAVRASCHLPAFSPSLLRRVIARIKTVIGPINRVAASQIVFPTKDKLSALFICTIRMAIEMNTIKNQAIAALLNHVKAEAGSTGGITG